MEPAAFGDLMWNPHPDSGSYNNIYSLRGFEKVQIPCEEVWALPGFNAGDNFMGLRVLDPGKSDTILAGLRIGTITAAEPDADELERLSKAGSADREGRRRRGVRDSQHQLRAARRDNLREPMGKPAHSRVSGKPGW